MILIKDRHTVSVTGNPAISPGKYDTYKGSTQNTLIVYSTHISWEI